MLKITEKEKQHNWTKQGVVAGEHYMQDDDYEKYVTLTKPILNHILDKYENRPNDAMNDMENLRRQYFGDFLFLGSENIPLAIEVSQWGYDVYVALTEGTQENYIKRTTERQGAQFQSLDIYNYFDGIPECALVAVTYTPNRMPDDALKEWLKILKNKADEILLCVQNDRDWGSFLEEYKVDLIHQDGYTSHIRIHS